MCRYEINNRKYGTEFDINLNRFHVCFRFSLRITASHANILPIALVSMWVRLLLAEWQHMRRSVPSVAKKKCTFNINFSFISAACVTDCLCNPSRRLISIKRRSSRWCLNYARVHTATDKNDARCQSDLQKWCARATLSCIRNIYIIELKQGMPERCVFVCSGSVVFGEGRLRINVLVFCLRHWQWHSYLSVSI